MLQQWTRQAQKKLKWREKVKTVFDRKSLQKLTDSCEELSRICDGDVFSYNHPIAQEAKWDGNNPHAGVGQRRVKPILLNWVSENVAHVLKKRRR